MFQMCIQVDLDTQNSSIDYTNKTEVNIVDLKSRLKQN